MFALSVPGSSIPASVGTEAIVAGSSLDLVDALLDAGLRDVVLACSADSLCHALQRCAGSRVLLIVDARTTPGTLSALRHTHKLLDGVTVVVRGSALDVRDRELLATARTLIWCPDDLPASTLARLAVTTP